MPRAGKAIIPLLALLAKALASPVHDRQFDRRSSLALACSIEPGGWRKLADPWEPTCARLMGNGL
jgi:hypothetical protein